MFNLNYRLLLLYKRFRKALLPCLLLLMALSSGAGQVPEFRVFTYRGGLACSVSNILFSIVLFGFSYL